MIKKWFGIALAAAVMLLAGCGARPDTGSGGAGDPASGIPGFKGYVVMKEGSSILVTESEPQDFSGNGGAAYYFEAVWFSDVPSEVSVGQRVEVWPVDGLIAESYPGQARAERIKALPAPRPEGAELDEAEAVRLALGSFEPVEYGVPSIRKAEFDAGSSRWIVHVSDNGQEGAARIEIPDKPAELAPPLPVIESDGSRIRAYQGSYCWSDKGRGACADYAGPLELSKDKPASPVAPGSAISFAFEGKRPDEASVTRWKESGTEAVKTADGSFQAPSEEGIYYFELSAVWRESPGSAVSKGSTSVVFVLEVKGKP